MCCLNSLAAVMPYAPKDIISYKIVPLFVKSCKDDIPKVKFCVSKLIAKNRQYIDQNMFSN